MTNDQLRALIDATIKANGVKAITGPVLNGILNDVVDTYELRDVNVFNQDATPTAIAVGDLWYKPTPKELYVWTGSVWELMILNGSIDTGLLNLDTTVGSGGDYATISAAITAGKSKLKLVSNVTEVANVNTNGDLIIDLAGFTLDMTTYQFTYTSGSCRIIGRNGQIDFAYTLAVPLFATTFDRFTLSVDSVTFDNNSTINIANISSVGTFSNTIVLLPNLQQSGFGTVALPFNGALDNVDITGGGVTCFNSVYSLNPLTGNGYLNYVHFQGTFQGGEDLAAIEDGQNITLDITNVGTYFKADGFIYNIKDINASPNVLLDLTGRITGGIFSNIVSTTTQAVIEKVDFIDAVSTGTDAITFNNCTFASTLTVNGDNYIIDNCRVSTGIAIDGDFAKISNTIVDSGTITMSGTAEDTTIVNCYINSAIVDGGVRTQIIGCNDETNIFVEDIDLPTGKTYRVNGVDIIQDALITVGSGGIYTTLKAAIDAGETDVVFISNVTEVADTTYNNITNVFLNGFTLSMVTFKFVAGTGTLRIFDGSIDFADTVGQRLFGTFTGTNDLIVNRIEFTNNSTIPSTHLGKYGLYDNVIINCSNLSYGGLGAPGGEVFIGEITNSEIIGSGSSSQLGINSSVLLGNTNVSNVTFSGNWGANCAYLGVCDSIFYTGSGVTALTVLHATSVYDRTVSKNLLNIDIQGYSLSDFYCNTLSNFSSNTKPVINNGQITSLTTISDSDITLNNIVFLTGLVVNDDNITVSNSTAVAGTITVNGVADNTTLIGCRTLTAISDSGTNTNIIGCEGEQNEFVEDINLPTGKTYKINDVDILLGGSTTVGTTGEYATIEDAIAASKYNLKLVSNITLTTAITISGNIRVTLDLNSFTLTSGEFRINVSNTLDFLEIHNGVVDLTFSLSGSEFISVPLTNRVNLYAHDLTIECNQTLNYAGFTDEGHLERVVFNINNPYRSNCSSSGGFVGFAKNITLNVNNATAYYCLTIANTANVEDLEISGSAPTNATGVVMLQETGNSQPILNGVTLTVNNTVYIAMFHGDLLNVSNATGNITLLLFTNRADTYLNIKDSKFTTITIHDSTNTSITKLTRITCDDALTITSTPKDINIHNCELLNGLTINGDYVTVNGSRVNTGTITVAATADKTILAFNRTQGAISDSGTNTVNTDNILL